MPCEREDSYLLIVGAGFPFSASFPRTTFLYASDDMVLDGIDVVCECSVCIWSACLVYAMCPCLVQSDPLPRQPLASPSRAPRRPPLRRSAARHPERKGKRAAASPQPTSQTKAVTHRSDPHPPQRNRQTAESTTMHELHEAETQCTRHATLQKHTNTSHTHTH